MLREASNANCRQQGFRLLLCQCPLRAVSDHLPKTELAFRRLHQRPLAMISRPTSLTKALAYWRVEACRPPTPHLERAQLITPWAPFQWRHKSTHATIIYSPNYTLHC